MKTVNQADHCPCGSAATYKDCCGALHRRQAEQGQGAPDALCLMRSRYSAYVLDLRDYLLATWHPSTRPATISSNEPGLKWLGLDVKQHKPIDADHAEVEFVARSKLAGRAYRLHERSRFVREHGFWFYVDGDQR
jgi:SEC-C motif-containing protein